MNPMTENDIDNRIVTEQGIALPADAIEGAGDQASAHQDAAEADSYIRIDVC